MNEIIARNQEKLILKSIMNSNKAEFLTIYGRRRIGKTYLISTFFNQPDNIYLEFTGLKKADDNLHRENFIEEIASKLNDALYEHETKNWTQVFRLLKKEISLIKDKKVIIFIDELPRFCAIPKVNFLEQLAHLWESFLSKQSNIVLVVSGSSASWMIQNIINETGTLYDRVTESIELLPLSLKETKEYLHKKNIKLNDKDIAELYMAIGGIPKYLDYVKSDESAFTAINRLFFNKGSILRVEFDKLFKSLYQEKSIRYKTILINAFSQENTIGKTIDQIYLQNKELHITKQTVQRIINDLVACGFIKKQEPFKVGKGGGNSLYYISDNYCIFYIRWILNSEAMTAQSSTFWIEQLDTPKWNAWKGFAFESICLAHHQQIKELLGLKGISTSMFGWHGSKQIDLLLDRSDNCINVFELKFYKDKFSISEEYAEELVEKFNALKLESKTKKSLIPIMITSYGCIRNSNYQGLIAGEITLLDLMN
jgi:AAA+ ATPase superfamily predicted ATPase